MIDGQMHLGHVRRQLVIQIIVRHWQILQEPRRHVTQRITRPGVELIHHHAGDKSRKLAPTDTERVTNWRMAQDQVQVLPHTVQEEGEQSAPVIRHACSLGSIANSSKMAIILLSREQIRDVAGCQQVIEEHQEGLVGNLAVRHQEGLRHRWLHSCLDVERLQVHLQVSHTVCLVDQDGDHIELSDETGQLRQRLLPRPSYSDEQGIPARQIHNPHDPRDMLHGVSEEDQVHFSKSFVVLSKFVFQAILELG
mmetsp:Transcript_1482/g.3531  ORF Transcript_1482/g.3531 Transcript_1482/m.3531 type:complete len:252 (-) Transcript_1482:379-1134(-)